MARRLDQMPDQVRDALTLFPEIEETPEKAQIKIVPVGEYANAVNDVREARNEAERAQLKANRLMANTARELYSQGLPYRDIGKLLDVSFQRVAQVINA